MAQRWPSDDPGLALHCDTCWLTARVLLSLATVTLLGCPARARTRCGFDICPLP